MPRGVKLVNSLILSVSCRLPTYANARLAVAQGQDKEQAPKLPYCILKLYNIGEFWRRSLLLELPHAHLLVPSSETTSVPTTPRWKEDACRQVSPRMRRRRVPGRIALLSGLGMSRARQPRAEFNRASLPVLPRWIKVAAAVRINSSLRWVLCRPDTRYGVGVAGGSCFGLDCCSLLLANMGLYDSELRQQGISLPYAGLL